MSRFLRLDFLEYSPGGYDAIGHFETGRISEVYELNLTHVEQEHRVPVSTEPGGSQTLRVDPVTLA